MLRLRHSFGSVTLILIWGLGVTAVMFLTLVMLMRDLAEMNTLFIASLIMLGTGATTLKVRRVEGAQNQSRANRVNRAVLMAISSPVFVVGDDNKIIQLNRAAEKLISKLGIRGGLPPEIQPLLDECRKTQNDFMPQEPQEAILFRIQEEEFYYLPRICQLDPKIAAQSGWAVLLQNISRARRLDEMKTNLLATVSHEIRTPLTGIRMALLLLLEELGSPLRGKQRTLIASASGDCERLLNTLNNLMDLAHAESGVAHLERAPISVRSTMERVVRLFAGAAASRNVDLLIEGRNEHFPEIHADSVRLDEVLNNLISNAIKHSPEGSRIILRATKPDTTHVRISVIDQGAGVPEASQGHIFERFYRAPGQNHQGVGLGLYIAKEIMAAHGGQIGLCERTGDSTEFCIDLPVA